MKKVLVTLAAVLLFITAFRCSAREGTFDEVCFKEENEIDLCYDDSTWHYNYWLKRKQDLLKARTISAK